MSQPAPRDNLLLGTGAGPTSPKDVRLALEHACGIVSSYPEGRVASTHPTRPLLFTANVSMRYCFPSDQKDDSGEARWGTLKAVGRTLRDGPGDSPQHCTGVKGLSHHLHHMSVGRDHGQCVKESWASGRTMQKQ